MMFKYNDGLTESQLKAKSAIVAEWTTSDASIDQKYVGPEMLGKSDLESFIDLVAKLIEEEYEDNPNKVKLLDEFPQSNVLEDPLTPGKDLSGAIFYTLKERAPGTMAKGNEPLSRSRRETSFRYRGWSVDDIKYPNQMILHYGKVFDNLVCFEVVAKTSKQANKLVDWFEEFMEVNREIFAKKGIVKYHFDKRESDRFLTRGETGYYVRPMVYYVRTERTYAITESKINKLVVKLSKT